MSMHRRILATLVGVSFAGWLLDRLWDRAFVAVETRSITLEDGKGRPRRGKRVRVQSIFAASPDAVWAKVTTPALLAHVAYPMLTFKRQDGAALPEIWQEGDTLHLNLFALGCIPLGPHTIRAERIDPERREIRSRETGRMAEIWRHVISVANPSEGHTRYTDEIDIYAGMLTGAVAAFARTFYRYRQTRWRAVIRRLTAAPDAAVNAQ